MAPVSDDLARQLEPFGAGGPRSRWCRTSSTPTRSTRVRRARGRVGRPPRLLSVGTLTAKKGHRDLLDALAREPLRGRGADPRSRRRRAIERPALAAQAEALGLDVAFHGELPKARVAELMRQADLFVLPSHYENLPVVLIEALASGLPAVATAVGGVPELVDGRSGVLCPPGDPTPSPPRSTPRSSRRAEFDPAAMAARAAASYGYEAVARALERHLRALDRLSAAAGVGAFCRQRSSASTVRRKVKYAGLAMNDAVLVAEQAGERELVGAVGFAARPVVVVEAEQVQLRPRAAASCGIACPRLTRLAVLGRLGAEVVGAVVSLRGVPAELVDEDRPAGGSAAVERLTEELEDRDHPRWVARVRMDGGDVEPSRPRPAPGGSWPRRSRTRSAARRGPRCAPGSAALIASWAACSSDA